MEIKVRALDSVEQKSVQEVEAELLKKHEQELAGQGDSGSGADDDGADDAGAGAGAGEGDDGAGDAGAGAGDAGQDDDLTEEKVLSFIGKKYNKQINSFDELMTARSDGEQLPEDVAAYLKYKKDTGRGIEDFLKLNQDYDKMDPDQLLRSYLSSTQQGLDEEDIDTLMEDLTYDEDLDNEDKVKKVKIARKKTIAEAKAYFNQQKEKYKLPLESRANSLSPEEEEEYQAFRQYTNQAKTLEEQNKRKREWFDQKTAELFGKEFKGFEFDINDKKIVFTPASADELKKNQSSPSNFIAKYLDEKGLIKDAAGYHRALAIAMNPDKFAQFFYEQGKASAIDGQMRNIKNINMSDRKVPEVINKGGVQVKAVSPDPGKGLKIRSIKKMN